MTNRAHGHESPSNYEIPEKVFESMKCRICRTEREVAQMRAIRTGSVKFAETEGKQSINQSIKRADRPSNNGISKKKFESMKCQIWWQSKRTGRGGEGGVGGG
jgi:hypothetical protein